MVRDFAQCYQMESVDKVDCLTAELLAAIMCCRYILTELVRDDRGDPTYQYSCTAPGATPDNSRNHCVMSGTYATGIEV